MSIFVFTEKAAVLKNLFPKNVQFLSMADITKHSSQDTDISYFDVSGIAAANLKKTLAQIKKSCKNTSWGIIDTKGSIKDVAALFFEGACDYLGPSFFKKSKIDPKRLKEAILWRKSASGADAEKLIKTEQSAGFLKNKIKLPASFPGWKKMQSGKSMSFYLLYCSFQGKTEINSRLGEKAFAQTHKRFLSFLDSNLSEADGLLWMDTGKDCLFLIPPKVKSAESVVEACIRMIISAPVIALETLGLSIPANFIFALHYGSVCYKPPGKTGTVVSDAVNTVFHLGLKKAVPGRLTITSDLPDVSIPKTLQDLFISCGEYEGRTIWHTKKFSYAKPWV
jgi:hypothetical protein